MSDEENEFLDEISLDRKTTLNIEELEKVGFKLITVDTYNRWEETYRRYLKGDVIEYNLAYRTARDQILDQLKVWFDLFLKNLKEEVISEK